MAMTRQRYKLIPSGDIDDQKILQSKLDQVQINAQKQPKAIVSRATFP